MTELSAGWIDASKVATCVVLASMTVFTVYYLATSRWWKSWLGRSIAIERLFFICLLALLTAQSFWPFSVDTEEGFLQAEVVLLLGASAGLSISTGALWVIRRKKQAVKIVPRDRP